MSGSLRVFLLLIIFMGFVHAESFYGLRNTDAGSFSDANEVPLSVSSVPFIENKIRLTSEGQQVRIDELDVIAKHLYLLGCVNSNKEATPGWGGTDDSVNYFVGDRIGELKLIYDDDIVDSVPLIFGFTVWWQEGYKNYSLPFSQDPQAEALLDNALCVANAARYYEGFNKEYFIRIGLRDKSLKSIVLEDASEKSGFFEIQGLSFGGVEGADISGAKYEFLGDQELPETLKEWLQNHTIDSKNPYPDQRRKAVDVVVHLLYTFPEDVISEAVTAVQVEEGVFGGPTLKFGGSVEAEILSNVFYDNVNEVLRRIDETGIVHESKKDAIHYAAFGSWRKLGAFYGKAYTRNHTLSILSSIGFTEDVGRAINFFDHWLMYFPMAYPQVQLEGKPIPGHCPVIANIPHIYFDELRHVGWPTKYSTRDFGNPENDGHGILMLGRYRQWCKTGRSVEWVRKHWVAINEAAEYIRWALDHPDLSFSEHGLLYNETEAGMMRASLYCDMPCYLGLLAYSQMAETIGEKEKSESWRNLAFRLQSAMEKYYPQTLEPYGEIWDPSKTADWNHQQGVMAPILFAAEMYGYDASRFQEKLPEKWIKRTENSYVMVRDKLKPAYCAPRGLGYGQNYFLQTSLLLDRVQDANKFLHWLARFCYAPRHPHPFRVPEGISMKSDGSLWRRWGDLGNLYQMNGTVASLLMLAGIDDYDPQILKIIPRIPMEWNRVSVTSYPVRALSKGVSETVVVDVELEHRKSERQISVRLKSEKIVDRCKVRLGPIPLSSTTITVKVEGLAVDCELITSGDTRWCWVDLEDVSDARIHARYE